MPILLINLLFKGYLSEDPCEYGFNNYHIVYSILHSGLCDILYKYSSIFLLSELLRAILVFYCLKENPDTCFLEETQSHMAH